MNGLCFLGQMTALWLIVCTLSLFRLLVAFPISIPLSHPVLLEVFYLYLGLPHQHIPINKRGGRGWDAAERGGGGKCGPEAGQWACAKWRGEWMEREGERRANCSTSGVWRWLQRIRQRAKEMKWKRNSNVKEQKIDSEMWKKSKTSWIRDGEITPGADMK